MKHVKVMIWTSLLLLSTAACQSQELDQTQIPPEIQAPIDVKFGTHPTTGLTTNEPFELYVEVTQEGDAVEDADEVLFEIWHKEPEGESGHHEQGGSSGAGGTHEHEPYAAEFMQDYETDHDLFEAHHQGNGVYVAELTLEKAETYYVMYHVTARDFHFMTTHEIAIQ